MTRRLARVAALALVCAFMATPALARHHGFICGLTQRLHFGLPSKYNLALAWAGLPHTSAQAGAVVVQRRRGRALGGGPGGHVSRIVSVVSQCRAVVTDEKGTYERDICKNLVAYVKPGL
jgi:hypothetical protein